MEPPHILALDFESCSFAQSLPFRGLTIAKVSSESSLWRFRSSHDYALWAWCLSPLAWAAATGLGAKQACDFARKV